MIPPPKEDTTENFAYVFGFRPQHFFHDSVHLYSEGQLSQCVFTSQIQWPPTSFSSLDLSIVTFDNLLQTSIHLRK